jgi:transposase InsO family protein
VIGWIRSNHFRRAERLIIVEGLFGQPRIAMHLTTPSAPAPIEQAARLDPRELRQVLGTFVTGVTVVTTVDFAQGPVR